MRDPVAMHRRIKPLYDESDSDDEDKELRRPARTPKKPVRYLDGDSQPEDDSSIIGQLLVAQLSSASMVFQVESDSDIEIEDESVDDEHEVFSSEHYPCVIVSFQRAIGS